MCPHRRPGATSTPWSTSAAAAGYAATTTRHRTALGRRMVTRVTPGTSRPPHTRGSLDRLSYDVVRKASSEPPNERDTYGCTRRGKRLSYHALQFLTGVVNHSTAPVTVERA